MLSTRFSHSTSNLSRLRLITGAIRWSAADGMPVGDITEAFTLVVKRKNRPQELQGNGRHSSAEAEPFDVSSRTDFSDASDQDGKAVAFMIFGLSNNEEVGEGHFPGDGYYEVTPVLKARWTGGFVRPSASRQVEPPFQRVTLSDNNPIDHMEFSLSTRPALH